MLKKREITLLVGLVIIFAMVFAACGEAGGEDGVVELGSRGPGGGVIVYENEEGRTIVGPGPGGEEETFKYFEAFLLPQKYALGEFSTFGDDSEHPKKGDSESFDFGMGKYNTQRLVALGSPAAKACADYRGGGYSDWFLPSVAEVVEIISKGDFISEYGNIRFWTSSLSTPWGLHLAKPDDLEFTLGNWYADGNEPHFVIAVRAFN